MSTSSASSRPGNTQRIDPEQWPSFLLRFTRDYRGAHARLQILDSEAGFQVETEDRPFDGISADIKDDERAVWIAFGSRAEDHFTHGIHGATAIWVLEPAGHAGAVLEVEARDGSKTVLELSRPEAYALPPGDLGVLGQDCQS